MIVRIPAGTDEACPKCHAVNPNDRAVTVWVVADERGTHYECDTCSNAWPILPRSSGLRVRIPDAADGVAE